MIYKTITNYENYKISEYGDVINIITNKKIKPWINNKGYKCVDLHSKDGTRKHLLVHRLVAIEFVPNINNDPIVLHKDNNKLNTHYSNLKWGTYSENNAQAIRDGLNKVPRPDNRKTYIITNNDDINILCNGQNEIIDNIGYGTNSAINCMMYNNRPIKCGKFKGCFIKRSDKKLMARIIKR